MNCETIKTRLEAYLNGELNEKEHKEVAQHLVHCADCEEEMAYTEQMWQRLETVAIPENSTQMRVNFYAILEQAEKAHQAQKSNVLIKIGRFVSQVWQPRYAVWATYSLFLVFMGIFLGYRFSPNTNEIKDLTGEVQNLREMMMLTMLQQQSATERLKAVSLSEELPDATDKVTAALLHTLEADENVNVRLAAAEALYKLASNPRVREGLVKALGKQDSPLVQMTLVEILMSLKDKSAAPALKELLKDANTNESVKIKAQECLQII